MSHFSKFVRPGYVRVKVQEEDTSLGMKITAYTGENKTVVVILNPSDLQTPVINLATSVTISSATAYTTTVSKSREAAILTPASNKVLVNIAANSITTVVINK